MTSIQSAPVVWCGVRQWIMGDLSSGSPGSPATSASRASSRRSDVSASSSQQQHARQPPRPLSQRSSSTSSLRGAAGGVGGGSGGGGPPEVVFVSAPDPAHMCPVCDRAMRYPVKLGDCGHRCCSGCLVELVRSVAAHHRR